MRRGLFRSVPVYEEMGWVEPKLRPTPEGLVKSLALLLGDRHIVENLHLAASGP